MAMSNSSAFSLMNFGLTRSSFVFGSDTNVITGSHFYAISVERAKYKESLFPQTFNLALSGSGGFDKIHLTNNSKDILVNTFLGSTRVMQVVSGSNGNAVGGDGFVAGSGSYGLFLPDIGTILLNPQALSQSIHLDATRTANSTNGVSSATLFDAIVEREALVGLDFDLADTSLTDDTTDNLGIFI